MAYRRAALVIALAMALLALTGSADAFARAGGGFSFGSRGSRTFSAPPITTTAPRPASPLGQYAAPNPGYASPAGSRGGFFSGGFGRGLIGGLVGAGLFGLLFGNGLFGGLGDGTSFIGLLIQLGLVYLAVKFAIGLFRARKPAFATAGTAYRGPLPGGTLGARSGAPAPDPVVPLPIQPADFDAFARVLVDVQTAYGREDVDMLKRLATPAMAAHFATEIADNARRGVVNRVADVRLLQGDLAEAWQEAGNDFATVAMRYSLLDTTVERGTGRPVAGSPTAPQEVTEIWTLARPAGAGPAGWKLSAIQQA